VWVYELDVAQQLGDFGAEGAEQLLERRELLFQLLALHVVVDDRRLARERRDAPPVLGMEVRERHEQRLVRQLADPFQQALAVAPAHAGVDDERRAVADDEADVRNEVDPLVGKHPHTFGDLLRRDLGNQRRRRGLDLLVHRHSFRVMRQFAS
jgi:hypothetical protein